MKLALINFIILLLVNVDQSQKLRHQKRLRGNQSIDEMKFKLFAVLNERAKISDVRENDVKEVEKID